MENMSNGNLQWTDKQLAALQGLQAGMAQADIRKTYDVGQNLITKVSKALKAGKVPSNLMPGNMPSSPATPPGGNAPAATPANPANPATPAATPAAPAAVKPGGAGGVPTKTRNIADASRVIFKPQVFEMESPAIIWQAMEACVRLWHWPPDMTPGQFLRAYLEATFMQRGVALSSFTVFDPVAAGIASQGKELPGGQESHQGQAENPQQGQEEKPQ